MFSKSFKSDIALTSPSGIVANSSTGATQIPVGTTAQRPVSPLPGTCRWNTSIASAEIWTGSTWYQYAQLTDPYFNNNVLLLNADAQTWLTDASSNNIALTQNNTAAASTLTPYRDSYYGNLFNGTTDYLTVPDSVSLQLGTGNFTIEAWTYVTTASTSRGIVSKGPGAATTGWECKFNSANVFRFEWTASSLVGVTTIPTNTWTHVAVVRSGTATGNVKLYVNGALYATSGVAVTDNFTQTDNLRVGTDRAGTAFFPGNISNLRIVKGTAVYTGAFTPSTSPLTLTQTSAPVTPTVDYLVVAGGGGGGLLIGGGGGAGGYLTATGFAVAANTSLTVTIGAGGAGTSASGGSPGYNGGNSVFSSITATGGGGGGVWDGNAGAAGGSGGGGAGSDSGYGLSGAGTSLQGNAGGNGNNGGGARLGGGGGGAGSVGGAAAGGLPGNGGSGLATSISGTATYYASGGGGGNNGSGGGTSPAGGGGAANVSGTANTGGGGGGGSNPTVAGSGGAGIVIIRYSNIYSLAAVTTGSPTVANIGGYYIYTWTRSGTITFNPTIAILSGTSLLTCQSNRFLDNSSNKLAITYTGTPYISQNQPFAVSNTYLQNGSAFFNGSNDYISTPANALLGFGTGDFTVELWFFQNAVKSGEYEICEAQTTGAFVIYHSVGTAPIHYRRYGSTDIPLILYANIPINIWTHVAISRTASVTTAFVNGVIVDSRADTNSYATPAVPFTIGGRNGGTNGFPGYISNFRVVKGVGLYTAAFTPSTTQLTTTTNVTALSAPPSAEILVVAGGGGGRDVSGNIAGIRDSAGGGAGGIIWNSAANLVAGVSYPIVIGAGGASATNGSNSTWNSSFDAIGGGAGGQVSIAGSAGGSGGGGANYLSAAGASNKVTYTGWTSYGNAGGAGLDTGPAWGAGGGGGAGAAGTAGTSTTGGTGGVGVSLTTSVGYTGYPAALFSGSNYLSAPSSAAFAYGTGDFTIEMWVYPTSASWTSGNYYFYGDTSIVGTLQYYQNQLSYYNAAVGTGGVLYNSGGVIVASTWSHIAISRQSGTTRMFINGRLIASASDTQNYSASVGVQIAAAGNGTSIFGGGYLSNVRIVKGTALYTSNFVVPTLPLTVTQLAVTATAPPTVDYLVVAGGGGGGANDAAGGGAGGFLTASGFSVASSTPITVTVGNGGAGATNNGIGTVGGNSVFSTITALGGGYGGADAFSNAAWAAGGPGGSGGGGGGGTNSTTPAGGLGTSGQGRNGGAGGGNQAGGYGGGGGGGAGAVGSSTVSGASGNGGIGLSSSITGTTTYYAGGGGGGSRGTPGTGGTGGGGAGTGSGGGVVGGSGTANTGGGGGGAGNDNNNAGQTGTGGTGGSGVVIIRYLAVYAPATATVGSPTITLSGGYRIYIFTASGSITFGDSTIAAITGTATSLLTCRSSTFVDISSNAFAITATGTPTMQPLVSPFAYTYYAGGGGGGAANSAIAAGGTGGGGASTASAIGGAGTANTGGGGGGVGNITGVSYAGGTGGSGVAIIKYPETYAPAYQVTGDPTILLSNGYRIYTWATSGSIIFDPTPTVATTVANTSLLTLQTKLPTNNNTFLDSSPNNFAITRTGTPTQGTFTPFSQTGWGGYFNGSTDYLNAAANAVFAFGTAAWTVEAWVYVTTLQEILVFDTRSSASTAGIGCRIDVNGTLYYSGSANNSLTSTAITANSWNHVAWVYNGTTLTGYINGVSGGTATPSFNITQNNGVVGRVGFAASGYMAGYMSNLRIVKGAAVYTANFTPSTTPLTTLSGLTLSTSLLTLQDNRFKDNSTNAFAITTAGTPSIQAFSPFNSGVTYNPAVVGGSMYFIDNTTTLSSISTTIQQFAAGDFTVEMWAYFVTIPGSSPELFQAGNFHLNFRGSPNIAITNDASVLSNLSNTIYPGVWTHIAAVRASGTMIIYLNGVGNTPATSQTYSFSQAAISIGSGASGFNAYISGLRIVNGIAVYTTNFAPPTALLTAINGTNLLLNGANSGIFDATGKNDIWTVGTTKVSNAIFKYGTGSMYFNGTTDYLTTTYSPNTQLGAGNFTIEFWVYFNSVAASQRLAGGDQPTGAGSGYNWCFFTGTGTLTYYLGSNGSGWDLAGGVLIGSVVISQWYHVALVRNGATVTPYLNGVAGTTTSVSTTALYANTYGPTIGAQNTAYFSGYIDDFRITKYARYTTAFTPPASAFLGS